VIIRQANKQDMNHLLAMGLHFFREGKFTEKGLTFFPPDFERFLVFLIESRNAIFLIAEEENSPIGSIAGVFSPWMLDYAKVTLTELWWWIEPEHRGNRVAFQLLKEYERTAKENNITHVIMGTHDNVNEGRLQSFYSRYGYKHLEHHYIKEI